jgi:hypothetical protein
LGLWRARGVPIPKYESQSFPFAVGCYTLHVLLCFCCASAVLLLCFCGRAATVLFAPCQGAPGWFYAGLICCWDLYPTFLLLHAVGSVSLFPTTVDGIARTVCALSGVHVSTDGAASYGAAAGDAHQQFVGIYPLVLGLALPVKGLDCKNACDCTHWIAKTHATAPTKAPAWAGLHLVSLLRQHCY